MSLLPLIAITTQRICMRFSQLSLEQNYLALLNVETGRKIILQILSHTGGAAGTGSIPMKALQNYVVNVDDKT